MLKIDRSSKVKYGGQRFDIIVDGSEGSGGGMVVGSEIGSDAGGSGSDNISINSDSSGGSGGKYTKSGGSKVILRTTDAEACLLWWAMLERTRSAVMDSVRIFVQNDRGMSEIE